MKSVISDGAHGFLPFGGCDLGEQTGDDGDVTWRRTEEGGHPSVRQYTEIDLGHTIEGVLSISGSPDVTSSSR